jgi:hypothetical protein
VSLLSPVTAFEGLGGVAGIGVLVALVRRRPAFGVALLLIAFLVSGYGFPVAKPPHLAVGPINLYAPDLAVIVVLLALLLPAAGGVPSKVPFPLWVVLGLIANHTARGIQAHGFQVALASARPWWWFAISALFVSTVRWEGALVGVLRWALIASVAVAAYGLAKYGISSSGQLRAVDGELLSLRALTGAGALLLLQLALLLAHTTVRFRAVLLLFASVTLIVVQQRTVWLAALAAGGMLALRWLGSESRARPQRAYAVVGVAFLFLPVAVALLVRSHSIAASLSTAEGPNSTLQWRISSWESSFHLLHGGGWLLGLSAGASLTRFVLGQVTSVGPHSLFVEAVVRFGLPGLVALIAVWASAVRRLRRSSDLPWPIWVGYAAVLSSAIFAFSYGPGLGTGVVLGLLLGATPALHPRSAVYPVVRPESAVSPA